MPYDPGSLEHFGPPVEPYQWVGDNFTCTVLATGTQLSYSRLGLAGVARRVGRRYSRRSLRRRVRAHMTEQEYCGASPANGRETLRPSPKSSMRSSLQHRSRHPTSWSATPLVDSSFGYSQTASPRMSLEWCWWTRPIQTKTHGYPRRSASRNGDAHVPPYSRFMARTRALRVVSQFVPVTSSNAPEAAMNTMRAFLPVSMLGQIGEDAARAETYEQTRTSAALDPRPLIVLQAGRTIGAPREARIRHEVRIALNRELAALSTNSSHRVIDGAGHVIQFDRPEAVIDAVLEVVAAARPGGRLSEPNAGH